MLLRDFEWEGENGICSYCGREIELIEAPDGELIYGTCFACDEYDMYGQFDDMLDLYPMDDGELYE